MRGWSFCAPASGLRRCLVRPDNTRFAQANWYFSQFPGEGGLAQPLYTAVYDFSPAEMLESGKLKLMAKMTRDQVAGVAKAG